MFKKILVPLDGSPLSEDVIPFAATLASRLNAQLLLFRVLERGLLERDTHDSAFETETREYLELIKQRLVNDFGFDSELVKSKMVSGEPAEEITLLSHTEKCDLIVMASHGRSGLSRLIMDSVAAEVIRKAPVPVIIRHSRLQEEFAGNPSITPIVVTLDGTPNAESSLEPAVELAQQYGCPLLLLRVLKPFVPTDEMEEWFTENEDKGQDYLDSNAFEYYRLKATNYLEKIAEPLRARLTQCDTALVVGDPSEEITNYVRAVEAKLLVIATQGHGDIYMFLLGSVADEVFQHCDVPVMLVHVAAHSHNLKSTEEAATPV
ncbi:universal stress protein [Candidatus Chlorohelix sp.]|uniref:universal stress protein n=1 Tax=Candidatus Chlorohelix sp. TaxID=3139201 RepID=UPI003034CFE7